MRFTILTALTLLLSSPFTFAQNYGLEVEVVSENIGTLAGPLGITDLTGYSCTRLYVTMNNATDFMSSVSGDAVNQTYINTTTSFYNAELGGATPNGINPVLYGFYPDLPYDSWVTVGLEQSFNASAGEAAVAIVQSSDNPWSTNFDPGFGADGASIAIDDAIGGAWYALNGDANGVAGDDLRVLVGQFTTAGELSGQLYCQIFIQGDGADEYRETFYFGTSAPLFGCTDPTACNYDESATEDDSSCEYPFNLYGNDNVDCNGACLNDSDLDLICDEDEIGGCQDDTACNYNSLATDDDGSCTYADSGLNCDGSCIADADGDGICDGDEVPGCTDETACNFSTEATDDDASCTYADTGLNCDGSCIADADGDGICDGDEVPGCTDETACNFNTEATDDDASCTYADTGLNCDGSCIADADGDGICDGDEVPGCTDETACNFSTEATDDDASCTYADTGLNCDGSCIADADGDGICDGDEVPGCTDETACNFSTEATDDDASCTYADTGLNCDGSCIADADGDGICDGDEVPGCTNAEANNYDEMATDDDGSCEYGCSPDWGTPNTYPSVALMLAQVTIGGENVSETDVVGAFVNGELRGEGDIIVSDGATFVNMTVYLAGGEETVTFALFNATECTTCNIGTEVTAMAFGEYGSTDDPLIFDANCNETTLEVDLGPGWNYVSTNITPSNYAIASLFESPLEGNLLKVLGDNDFALGQSYTPGIPSVFNSLQMHMDAAGYVIKVEEGATWTSTGTPLEANNTPLDLNEGWNIIGYVPQNAMAVETALASLDGLVGTVIDGQSGTVWNPANPNEFNSLLDLVPGRSYWVRMIEAGTLTYPQGNNEVDGTGMVIAHTRTEDNPASLMTGWDVVRAPGAVALAAEAWLDGAPIQGEAYIGAFVNQTCVAARPLMSLNGMSAAQMALMLEGPADVQFKLWLDGEVYGSSDEMYLEPGQEWGQAGAALPIIHFQSSASAVASADWVHTFSITPVPAQGQAWINLELWEGGQVLIQVLDVRGATLATIYDGAWPAGAKRLPLNVEQWAAGTYFVKGRGDRGTFSAPFIVK